MCPCADLSAFPWNIQILWIDVSTDLLDFKDYQPYRLIKNFSDFSDFSDFCDNNHNICVKTLLILLTLCKNVVRIIRNYLRVVKEC